MPYALMAAWANVALTAPPPFAWGPDMDPTRYYAPVEHLFGPEELRLRDNKTLTYLSDYGVDVPSEPTLPNQFTITPEVLRAHGLNERRQLYPYAVDEPAFNVELLLQYPGRIGYVKLCDLGPLPLAGGDAYYYSPVNLNTTFFEQMIIGVETPLRGYRNLLIKSGVTINTSNFTRNSAKEGELLHQTEPLPRIIQNVQRDTAVLIQLLNTPYTLRLSAYQGRVWSDDDI